MTTPMPAAHVTLEITDFPPVPPPQVGTVVHAMNLQGTYPYVKKTQPDRLNVSRGGGPLRFQITPAAGDPHTYRAIGIAFNDSYGQAVEWTTRPGYDPNTPFTGVSFDGSSVELSDLFAITQPAQTFKFCLLVQRSDGRFGILDPYIENENEA